MKKKRINLLSVAVIMLFSICFAACGKSGNIGDDTKDKYEYLATFEDIPIVLDNSFISHWEVKGDIAYILVSKYNPDTYESEGMFLHKMNLVTKEDSIMEFDDTGAGDFNGSCNFFHVFDDESCMMLYDRWNEDTFEETYIVRNYSKDNKFVSEFNLSDVFEESAYIDELKFTKDNDTVFAYDDTVYVIGKEGSVKCKLKAPNWISELFLDNEGNIYVNYWALEGNKRETKKVDVATKSFVDGFGDLPVSGNIIPQEDGTILIASDTSAYEFDVNTKEVNQLWNWLDLDMTSFDGKTIVKNQDGSYSLLNQVYDGDNNAPSFELVNIKKTLITPENAKKTIVFSCTYLDWVLRDKIIDFNKKNQEYKVKVNCYEGEDYEELQARFDADIASGNTFDIVSVDSFAAMNYAKKGAFLDLSKVTSKDSEYNRTDYFENILDAFKVNDKDYFVIPEVSIYTMVGPKSVFEGKTSWTVKDLLELRKENKDKGFFTYPTRENALYETLFYSIDSFVDFEKGKCDFCTQEFYDFLEFAYSFPKDMDYENYDSWDAIQQGDVLVTDMSLYNFDSYTLYNQLFEGGISIIGRPVESGSGHIIASDTVYAISAKTKNAEGAWEFLKSIIDAEEEREYYNGFPIKKTAFDRMMEEVTKEETYIDENGVSHVISHGSWGNGNINIEMYPPKKEDVEVIRNIFLQADKTIQYDEKLFEILEEEVKPYFEGQKSAEEVANIIQSRISIYLAEIN